jgi:fumarate hydratase class I
LEENILRTMYVLSLPRHASCPVGLGVSCSADRNIKGKSLKTEFCRAIRGESARLLPDTAPHLEPAVDIDLNQPMADL